MTGDMRDNFNGDAKPPVSVEKDARLSAVKLGALVHAGRDDEAFAQIEKSEPGSQLPLLMALAEDVRAPNGTTARLRERAPWLDFWCNHDFIEPMFDGLSGGRERLLENTRIMDRAKDDSFIIKLAVVSGQSPAMVPYLLDMGDVELNTKNDRPLTLAIVLGKPALIPLLAESGADLYAAKAEAFHLARQQPQFDVYTELLATAKQMQRDSQKKLMKRASEGVTPKILRAGDDETGLHLAAKAGMIGLLLTHDMLSDFTADDFLKPSRTGATVASILCARGEGKSLFDERIWRRRLDEADKVFAALHPHDQAQVAEHYDALVRARTVDRDIADMHSRWPRFTLPPKPDKP